MNVRPATVRDHGAIDELTRAAFDGHVEAELIKALRATRRVACELVVEGDGVVMGHVLLSKMESPAGSLALAPIAVLPSRQRQGIGSRLMKAAIDNAKRGSWNAIFLLGDPAFYGRFGFSVEDCRDFETVYPAEYMQVLPIKDGALDGLARKIVYPEPFSRDYG